MPRYPVRANGRKRYEQLVTSAKGILERDGLEALSIQLIADTSDVPKASVYHFFPHTSSACIAVADRYFSELGGIIERPIIDIESMHWRTYVEKMMLRAIRFYARNTAARRLILGSDYSWQVRQADLRNNKVMMDALLPPICKYFALSPTKSLKSALTISISIGEAVWALSVAETGTISRKYARESIIAVCAYLENYFEAS